MGLPSWRVVFDKVERAVGAPLEDAVSSPRYGKAVSFWVNGPRAVNRTVRRKVDDGLAGVLHALNVPAHGDVQRLSRQLALLTSEVRALSLPADRIAAFVDELQQREGAIEAPAARSALPSHGARAVGKPDKETAGGA